MLGLKLVAFDAVSTSLGVGGVETETMFAGDERECLSEIAAQFVGRTSFAGIVTRDSKTTTEATMGVFETADVVALPAMKRNGDARKLGEGFADINAESGITFPGEGEGAFENPGGVGHNRVRARTLGSWRIQCQGSRV